MDYSPYWKHVWAGMSLGLIAHLHLSQRGERGSEDSGEVTLVALFISRFGCFILSPD